MHIHLTGAYVSTAGICQCLSVVLWLRRCAITGFTMNVYSGGGS